MFKEILYLFLFLPILTFSAEPTRGTVESLPSGDIKWNSPYLENTANGDWELFDSEGILIQKYFNSEPPIMVYHHDSFPDKNIELFGRYSNNTRDGFWQLCDSKGILIRIYSYYGGGGLNNYNIKNYSTTGLIQSSGLIKNKKQSGEWSFYDKEGYLLETIPFVDGIKHGISFTYNRYLVRTHEIHYENGVPTVSFTIVQPK